MPRDSLADQLCGLFEGAKADLDQAARGSGGQRQYFRGPYDPDSVWNLADNVITSRGEASLFTIMDIANALRCMNGGDQNRFVFQMSRVLSIARLMEARCQGLFTGHIAAQRNGREEIVKRKKYRREREEMRLELTAAQADIAKAASTLASVRQQYGEQQQELHDDNGRLAR